MYRTLTIALEINVAAEIVSQLRDRNRIIARRNRIARFLASLIRNLWIWRRDDINPPDISACAIVFEHQIVVGKKCPCDGIIERAKRSDRSHLVGRQFAGYGLGLAVSIGP